MIGTAWKKAKVLQKVLSCVMILLVAVCLASIYCNSGGDIITKRGIVQNMFEHFFLEFRISVYPKIKEVRSAKSRDVLVALAVAVGLIMVKVGVERASLLLFFGGISLFVLVTVCLWRLDQNYVKKHRKEIRQSYANEKLVLLTELLKDEDFNLYSPENISYLIACCENSLMRQNDSTLPKLGALGSFMSAAVMVTLGALFEKVEAEQFVTVFAYSLTAIFVICGLGINILLIRDSIRYPKRDALIILKNELEYIRSELLDREAGTEKQAMTEAQEVSAVSIQ